MVMKAKLSRFEMNRKVRTILQKNKADLALLQFSCAGRSVRLSGELLKNGGIDFSAQNVETLVAEIVSIPGLNDIISEVTNWKLQSGSISKLDSSGKAAKEEENKKEVQEEKKEEE